MNVSEEILRKRRLVIRHKKLKHIKKEILAKSKSYDQKSSGIDNLIENDIKYFKINHSKLEENVLQIQREVKKVEFQLKKRLLESKSLTPT